MIKKAMFKKVQELKRQGFSKAAVGQALELDPRTRIIIQSYLKRQKNE